MGSSQATSLLGVVKSVANKALYIPNLERCRNTGIFLLEVKKALGIVHRFSGQGYFGDIFKTIRQDYLRDRYPGNHFGTSALYVNT